MTADSIGGVFTYAADLAEGLAQRGVEVSLATFGRRMTDAQRRRLDSVGLLGVDESELALEWMADPWADVEQAERHLLEIESRERPDVVHLNAFAPGAAAWKAPALVVGHSCVCSWWWAVHGEAPPPSWDRYRATVRRGLAGAAGVVAPSRAMLAELTRWYGPLPARSAMIPNGSAYLGSRSTVPKRPVALCAGRLWDEAKNVGVLLRAAARPGLRGRVLLAGEGELHSAGGGVVELGSLAPDRLAAVRRSAAVYVAPARYEPFGLGVLEAARDRCALIVGDIASLREIWGTAAVYVDPDDEERLAHTLEALLGNPERAGALGERARRHAERYCLDAMADAYLSLYGELTRAERVAA
jgi:glycogen(starch) synthase